MDDLSTYPCDYGAPKDGNLYISRGCHIISRKPRASYSVNCYGSGSHPFVAIPVKQENGEFYLLPILWPWERAGWQRAPRSAERAILILRTLAQTTILDAEQSTFALL